MKPSLPPPPGCGLAQLWPQEVCSLGLAQEGRSGVRVTGSWCYAIEGLRKWSERLMKDFWAFPGPETILELKQKGLGELIWRMLEGEVLVKVSACHFKGFWFFFFFSFNNPHRSPFVCTAHFCFLLTSPSSARLYPGRRKQAFPPMRGPGIVGGLGHFCTVAWQDMC